MKVQVKPRGEPRTLKHKNRVRLFFKTMPLCRDHKRSWEGKLKEIFTFYLPAPDFLKRSPLL